jgi:LPXTG-motif cell wall-anchored protein
LDINVKKYIALGTALTAVGALVFAASPALAVSAYPTLPTGSKMIAIDCDDDGYQVWDMDMSTGDSTPIGTPTVLPNDGNCAPSGFVSPVDGKAYFIDWGNDSDLATVDLETGVSTKIATLNGAATDSCGIFADAAGNAYNVDSSNLYSLNLQTGESTLIGDTGLDDQCANAINPVDGKLYWFTETGTDSADVYTVDLTTAVATLVTPALDLTAVGGSGNWAPDALAFDGNGIAWLQDDSCTGGPQYDSGRRACGIEPINLTTGEVWAPQAWPNDKTLTVVPSNGDADSKGYFYTMGLLYVPGNPELPDTGMNASLIAAIGGLLAVAGVVVFVVGRRRSA